jgi:hypothetical protein
MRACDLHVSFIPLYNCVTMRIISPLSVICNGLRRIKKSVTNKILQNYVFTYGFIYEKGPWFVC